MIRGRVPSLSLSQRIAGHSALVTYISILISLLAVWGLTLKQAGSFGALVTRLDFINTYVGSYLLTHGQAARLYDPATQLQTQQALTTPYAPFLHALYF